MCPCSPPTVAACRQGWYKNLLQLRLPGPCFIPLLQVWLLQPKLDRFLRAPKSRARFVRRALVPPENPAPFSPRLSRCQQTLPPSWEFPRCVALARDTRPGAPPLLPAWLL